MGNFLDTPITDKETEVGEAPSKGMSYGLSAMQGWRAQMEDDHVQQLSMPDLPGLSLFGVYDGHGGDTVAHYVAKHFPRCLLEVCDRQGSKEKLSAGEDFVKHAEAAFEEALMNIDAEMRRLQELDTGHDQSGSTSVMTLISNAHIVCANTGDSRAVLSREATAVALSHDHKPYNPEEKERIENAGSHVKFNRVNGDLAVSRALGDFVYKRCETVSAKDQAVTAFPEMISLERHGKDEFIVLACDGIWDVMSSQEVVDKVREMLLHGRPELPPMDEPAVPEEVPPPQEAAPRKPPREWDLGAVAECLIDHCLRLGSRDNMSVIIVLLDQSLAPKKEGGAPTGGVAASVGSASTAASPGAR